MSESKPWQVDPIDQEPSMVGTAGRAWSIDVSTLGQAHGCLAGWLVEAPWAHPLWHSYIIWLVHLAPVEGLPEATVYLPGATHEVSVCALTPDYPRQPVLSTGAIHILMPPNFCAQIVEAEDKAIARVEQAVRWVVDGVLSPDIDFIHGWGMLFGFNMVKDVLQS